MVTTAFQDAGAKVDLVSLKFYGAEISWEKYQQLGEFLGTLGRAYPWWVGDFLNYGEDVFGEDFAQIEASLPHSEQTLANYKSVAKHVPRTRRRKSLSYSVHADVAYFEPAERDRWLDKAEDQGWKRDQMRAALKEAKALESPEPIYLNTCPNCGHSY